MPTKTARIELRLRELAQLFNSMDPSPFLDRDLDGDAEEFIVSWAREHPAGQEFELVVHLIEPPLPERAAGVEAAVQHYFMTRALMMEREFRVMMRRGRQSLLIGLLFLTGCLFFAGLIEHQVPEGTAPAILRESLTILGWVAMWKPLQLYLYDWWPVREEQRLFGRLARMRVRLVPPAR
ncbi:MAG TPA: hypothetical protein VG710_19220 [Opitutus sp.]|nr:hypothetical protein [Opitutus sp.]